MPNLGISKKQREKLQPGKKMYCPNFNYYGIQALTIAKWNGTKSFFASCATIVGDANIILYDNWIFSYIQAESVSGVE